MKKKDIKKGLLNLVTSLIISTLIIYLLNSVAGIGGADYNFTHGEIFIMWILMAILVNKSFENNFF